MKLCDVCCSTDAEGKDEKLGLLKKFSYWFSTINLRGFYKSSCLFRLVLVIVVFNVEMCPVNKSDISYAPIYSL